jgi:proteasome lid subunit RPN8/RPN11
VVRADPPAPPPAPRAHPGPARVVLPASMIEAILRHCQAEAPNEACGVILGDRPAAEGGRPLRWEPTRNRAASPFRYEIDPADLLRLTLAADEAGQVFWGIVHSHVRTPARPSPTDVGLAFYPDALYLLVSLSAAHRDPRTGRPALRAWRIVGGEVFEVEVVSEG